MAWGLHDTTEVEKLGRPAVTVITTAFEKAARVRARILGMEALPIVAMQHPLASKTAAEIKGIAGEIVEGIAQGLMGAKG